MSVWIILFFVLVIVCWIVCTRQPPITGGDEMLSIALAHKSAKEKCTARVLKEVLAKYKPPIFTDTIIIDEKATLSSAFVDHVVIRAWSDPMDVIDTFVHVQWLFKISALARDDPERIRLIDMYKNEYGGETFGFEKLDHETRGGLPPVELAAMHLYVLYWTDKFMKDVVGAPDSYLTNEKDPLSAMHSMILANWDRVGRDLATITSK